MKWNIASRKDENPGALFRKNIQDVFDDFFSFNPTDLMESGWAPRIDVEEKEGAVHVKAEVPGITENDLNVTISDNVLTIAGEKKEEKTEEQKGHCVVSERFFGSFSRKVVLPEGIKADEIKAEYKNGVLSIDVPLSETKQPKKITVM